MNQNLLYIVHALLHSVGAIVVLPYVAMALFFAFVGQLASSKGLLAAFDTALKQFEFVFCTAIFVAPVLWVLLVVMGFLPSLQRSGSVCLGLLAVVSLSVIILLNSTPLELGPLLFLVPCIAVAATSIVLVFRSRIFV